MVWEITELNKPLKLKSPFLIEGLPGIGNVGKIALDFIIEQLKPTEVYDFYSHSMPHSVFVTKENLVELPKIRLLMLKRALKRDLVFLAGDVQPLEEVSSHEFTGAVLDLAETIGVNRIITLGGIGLAAVPKQPQIYIIGNCEDVVEEFYEPGLRRKLVGIVGPIVGVTGLLLGLGWKRNIKAVAYLVESFAHPLHVGIKEAQVLLKVLNRRLSLGLNMKQFNKKIEELGSIARLNRREPPRSFKETSYIG